jgi:hypothetical protein
VNERLLAQSVFDEIGARFVKSQMFERAIHFARIQEGFHVMRREPKPVDECAARGKAHVHII